MPDQNMPTDPMLPERGTVAVKHRIPIIVLLLIIAFGTALRVQYTLSTPSFNFGHPQGQLMSDPALLFYLTKRIIDGGGLPPDDFRADRRVEHPDPVDLPAIFTVGQEFYLAWGYRLLGCGLPLHVYCIIAMSLFASLAVLGVYGLTRELTEKAGWAAFAAAVYALTTANYRTIGFILMREDFSLPFFALHLWLMARAMRLGTVSAYVSAALALLAALATWHAMTFVATLEMVALFVWYLRTGRNPLSTCRAWLFPVILVTGCLPVPVLRAKGFLLSLPMLLLYGLLLLSWLERRRVLTPAMRFLTGLVLCTLALMVSHTVAGDYSHVYSLIWSKLIYLGRPPEDPMKLDFGARLLWQGPFDTGSPYYLLRQLGIPGLMLMAALIGAAKGWWRGHGDDRTQGLLALAALSLVASLFIKRLVVLDGLIAPVFTAYLLSRLRWPIAARTTAAVTLGVQSVLLITALLAMIGSSWYPQFERRSLAAFLFWARSNLDGKSAIATDFVNSAAILAHTNHSVIMQPKYETRASRNRIERYFTAFYHGSPADLKSLLMEFKCRYLLVDGYRMIAFRYQGGLAWRSRPAPGTAAETFLSSDPAVYTSIPGFRLIGVNRGKEPTWRVYEIEQDGG